MTQNTFLRQIRAYAQLALRKRLSFVDAVRAIALARWATISEGVDDPAELDALARSLSSMVVRDYGLSDPDFQPTEDVAYSWFRPSA